jgi:hypothetical protein
MAGNKENCEVDRKCAPENGRTGNPLTSWGAVLALLGAGALPCPDCGMPLAWHLWPLAILILAGKWIGRRRRNASQNQAQEEPALKPGER